MVAPMQRDVYEDRKNTRTLSEFLLDETNVHSSLLPRDFGYSTTMMK